MKTVETERHAKSNTITMSANHPTNGMKVETRYHEAEILDHHGEDFQDDEYWTVQSRMANGNVSQTMRVDEAEAAGYAARLRAAGCEVVEHSMRG